MIKKNNAGRVDNSSKNKKKYKQMFNQLQTIQEQRIANQTNRISNNTQRQHEIIQQQDQSNSLQIPNAGGLDSICQSINRLFSKNKITAKNAFDVPFIDLQKMNQFNNTDQNQFAWKRLSSTLENDCKLFSLRVDAAHLSTFKILNNMSRHQQKQDLIEDKQKLQSEGLNNEDIFLRSQNFEMNPNAQSKHLQKNLKNINIQTLEYKFDFNPIFERTKRKFDQAGLKGILLNNIEIDKNLSLLLNTNHDNQNNQNQSLKIKNGKKYSIPPDIKQISSKNRLSIFQDIQHYKNDLMNFYKQTEERWPNFHYLWGKLENGMLTEEDQTVIKTQMLGGANRLNINFDMQVQQQKDAKLNSRIQLITNAVNFKSKKTYTIQNLKQQQKLWINDDINIKKLLGIDGYSKKNQSSKPIQNVQDDFIIFNNEVQQMDEIINPESKKNQFNQQIQDKFLLPLTLFRDFRVQQPLTLKEQQKPENYEQIQQVQQVRMQEIMQYQMIKDQAKRTQMTIKDTKQQLKIFLNQKINNFSTFYDVYDMQTQSNNNVSPALCFLTLLHLANENGLTFSQENDENFYIK